MIGQTTLDRARMTDAGFATVARCPPSVLQKYQFRRMNVGAAARTLDAVGKAFEHINHGFAVTRSLDEQTPKPSSGVVQVQTRKYL